MKPGTFFLIFFILLSVSISCQAQKKDKTTNGQIGTLPPVETQPANTNYAPAFEGQTRIGGVKTTTPYEVK
jgi:hypothetical protein